MFIITKSEIIKQLSPKGYSALSYYTLTELKELMRLKSLNVDISEYMERYIDPFNANYYITFKEAICVNLDITEKVNQVLQREYTVPTHIINAIKWCETGFSVETIATNLYKYTPTEQFIKLIKEDTYAELVTSNLSDVVTVYADTLTREDIIRCSKSYCGYADLIKVNLETVNNFTNEHYKMSVRHSNQRLYNYLKRHGLLNTDEVYRYMECVIKRYKDPMNYVRNDKFIILLSKDADLLSMYCDLLDNGEDLSIYCNLSLDKDILLDIIKTLKVS